MSKLERRARRRGYPARDGTRARRGRVRALRRLPRRRGLDGILALGHDGGGDPAATRRSAVARSSSTSRPPGDGSRWPPTAAPRRHADTVALAGHAAETGADAVAVIGPPYFQLDDRALLEHFAAAAAACAPVPFYVYEFERASGYAVPLPVLEALRERAPNLAGLKVSDAPFERVLPATWSRGSTSSSARRR